MDFFDQYMFAFAALTLAAISAVGTFRLRAYLASSQTAAPHWTRLHYWALACLTTFVLSLLVGVMFAVLFLRGARGKETPPPATTASASTMTVTATNSQPNAKEIVIGGVDYFEIPAGSGTLGCGPDESCGSDDYAAHSYTQS